MKRYKPIDRSKDELPEEISTTLLKKLLAAGIRTVDALMEILQLAQPLKWRKDWHSDKAIHYVDDGGIKRHFPAKSVTEMEEIAEEERKRREEADKKKKK